MATKAQDEAVVQDGSQELGTGHRGLAQGHQGLGTSHQGLGTGQQGLATGHQGVGTGGWGLEDGHQELCISNASFEQRQAPDKSLGSNQPGPQHPATVQHLSICFCP